MIFTKGEIVRPINRVCKSEFYEYWHSEYKKMNKLLTREQSKKYITENIYQAYLESYIVIGYVNTRSVCVENVDTKDICIFDERKLTYVENKCKEYNIPSFLKSDINKIIVNERYIEVILNDGNKGTALCHKKDEFIETVGIKIAYLRARANSTGNVIDMI